MEKLGNQILSRRFNELSTRRSSLTVNNELGVLATDIRTRYVHNSEFIVAVRFFTNKRWKVPRWETDLTLQRAGIRRASAAGSRR